MKLNLIYCKNNQNVIGVDNDLLYNIPEDMKYFKNITTQEYIKNNKNIVIMGYNTWKSIPEKYKPLENRINIIITNNHYDEFKSDTGIFLTFRSFDDCYNFLSDQELRGFMMGAKFIIGGAQLYNFIFDKYYDLIDTIYETYINYSINLDEYDTSILNFTIEQDKGFTKLCKKYNDCNIYFKGGTSGHGATFYLYQKNFNINHNEKQYLDLMKDILYKNNIKDSRNSKVISSFGEKLVFDLRDGFPLLTTKRMPFKTILRELLWFIKGSTSNKELNEKNVHIWDANASPEFIKSRGLNYKEGELGPVYGFQWRRFGAKYSDTTKAYLKEEGIDQLVNVIDLMSFLELYGDEYDVDNMNYVQDVISANASSFRLWFEGNYQCGYRARYAQRINSVTGEIVNEE